MTNRTIDPTRPIHPQLQDCSDEILGQLWADALRDAIASKYEGLDKPDYLLASFVLESARQEMTRRIQGKLDHLFAHDMDKFLEVINFLASIEETS